MESEGEGGRESNRSDVKERKFWKFNYKSVVVHHLCRWAEHTYKHIHSSYMCIMFRYTVKSDGVLNVWSVGNWYECSTNGGDGSTYNIIYARAMHVAREIDWPCECCAEHNRCGVNGWFVKRSRQLSLPRSLKPPPTPIHSFLISIAVSAVSGVIDVIAGRWWNPIRLQVHRYISPSYSVGTYIT